MEMGHLDRRLPKFDSNGLTEKEAGLIRALTPGAKATLLRLNVPSLRRHKERLVGFRSDDLLSLCDFAQKGALQVGRRESTVGVMAKNGDFLYLSANPESALLQQLRPELLTGNAPKTLADSIRNNRMAYGSMAVRQAIGRSILPLIPNIDRFADAIAEGDDDDFYDRTTADGMATFMEETIGAISGLNSDYLAVLSTHTGYSVHDLTAVVEQFRKRDGILIGIDERAAKDFGLGTIEQAEGREGEVVILTPDGTIPLEYVVGFETTGDFEEGIMERLETGD